VWVLGGPQLVRLGEKLAGGADENRWRRTMLPIFQRYCRMCHLPGGSANLDLSAYSQWAPRRDRIRQRLIEQAPTPMPPVTVGALTPAELLAVQRWVSQGP
jgi:mono/diheme cytochrome c family protein